MNDTNEKFMLGAERWGGGHRRARPAHIFRMKSDAKHSLCGRVHEASIWNLFPGTTIPEADCTRCLERWRALGEDLMGGVPA